MKTFQHLICFLTIPFILLACGKKQESVEQKSEFTEITSQQFNTDSMQLGEIETLAFEKKVECNGSIVTLPNGMAKLNAPVNGIIKSINCFNGQSVGKNQALIEITGNEIIDTQKEFAEASANFKRLKNEYERIKSLYHEKVTSEKDYIIAESEYKTAMAKYNGLKLKIEVIGLSISKIENGEFYGSYFIKAPINGYISNLKANIGSYVDAQTEILEIINPAMFQIKLSVFASDINSLKIGQIVRFSSSNSTGVHFATINSLGVTVDSDTKSIECYASISDKNLINPIINEFITSEIITSIDSVKAIPTDALIKTESGYAVLVLHKQEKEQYLFTKKDVKVGRQQNGFSEILENQISGQVITKGAYNITVQ